MKTKNIIMIVLLVFAIPVVGMAMGQLHQAKQVQKQHDVYYCPMHPQILYDHPGTCPICGMALIKKESTAALQRPPCGCCGLKRS